MTFSLGLNGGGGSYIRFAPSVNSWTLGKEEITLKTVYFDLDSIKTGWGMMAEGQAPQWVWDEAVGSRGRQPEGEFKRGFSVRVWLGPEKGWAEWSSTGTGPGTGFQDLAAAAMPQKEDNPGKVLVARYTGSTAIKVGKGSTRIPNFEIVGWADRPDDDDDIPPHDEIVPKRAAPPATGSKAVPPPAKKAAASAEDFG